MPIYLSLTKIIVLGILSYSLLLFIFGRPILLNSHLSWRISFVRKIFFCYSLHKDSKNTGSPKLLINSKMAFSFDQIFFFLLIIQKRQKLDGYPRPNHVKPIDPKLKFSLYSMRCVLCSQYNTTVLHVWFGFTDGSINLFLNLFE